MHWVVAGQLRAADFRHPLLKALDTLKKKIFSSSC